MKKSKWGKAEKWRGGKTNKEKNKKKTQKCNEYKQIGGTETVGENLKELPLKNKEKQLFKNEKNEVSCPTKDSSLSN